MSSNNTQDVVILVHPYLYTKQFHIVFGHPVRNVPQVPSVEERLLRVKIVLEEAAEFAEASGFPVDVRLENSMIPLKFAGVQHDQPHLINPVEAADGLGDLNVVVNGSALVWGFPIGDIDKEIFRSNMSKLGEGGKPIQTPEGKIVKGPNYFPPDIRKILLAAGWCSGRT